jgi:hypothetical protein
LDDFLSNWQQTLICLSLQGGSKPRPRFELDSSAKPSDQSNPAAASMFNKDGGDKDEGGKRRPSYMPTRGLAAVLNQGLATLGEKLGKIPTASFSAICHAFLPHRFVTSLCVLEVGPPFYLCRDSMFFCCQLACLFGPRCKIICQHCCSAAAPPPG